MQKNYAYTLHTCEHHMHDCVIIFIFLYSVIIYCCKHLISAWFSYSLQFAKIGEAPNGTLLGRFEHLSLHMAREVVDTFEGLKSGLNTKLITILAYLSLGIASPHMVCTCVHL